ncbi:hypothetical protein VPH35_036084 [Triticum aestivum]|uniref:Uncharacterized protein n=1 Tax=Aegilops tauschii subsp. strangulata TaxID=200361 RepID=A0A453B6Q9_AEGTS
MQSFRSKFHSVVELDSRTTSRGGGWWWKNSATVFSPESSGSFVLGKNSSTVYSKEFAILVQKQDAMHSPPVLIIPANTIYFDRPKVLFLPALKCHRSCTQHRIQLVLARL